ncbi:MAG: hypothetical protein ACRENE_16520 [Polyangiaceae bacterium]
MKPESRALAQALLDHHRLVTNKHPPPVKKIGPASYPSYTIRYGLLCDRAGVGHVLRIVGNFLGEVAEWCAENEYPPINALAVNETGVPGEGYDGAGGFKAAHWGDDVEKCIRFTGYPAKMP